MEKERNTLFSVGFVWNVDASSSRWEGCCSWMDSATHKAGERPEWMGLWKEQLRNQPLHPLWCSVGIRLRVVLWKACFIRKWEIQNYRIILGSRGWLTSCKEEANFTMIRIKILGHNWKLRKLISQMHRFAPFCDLIKYFQCFPFLDLRCCIFFYKTYVSCAWWTEIGLLPH